MRGTMLWFNEDRGSGVITTETGERVTVQATDFAAGPPEGRCSGVVVEFRVAGNGDGRRAERVVVLEEVAPRRARRRGRG
jgi:cold shock CspA family protein